MVWRSGAVASLNARSSSTVPGVACFDCLASVSAPKGELNLEKHL